MPEISDEPCCDSTYRSLH